MTKVEYLLICLIEECAEIQHAVSKAIRFGLEDINPHTDTTNIDNINNELGDLLTVIGTLREEINIHANYNGIKMEKTLGFIEYSIRKGLIKD